MNEKNIKYFSKEVYGKTMYYLANSEQNVYWMNVTGKKTITGYDMQMLTNLTGVKFERVFEGEK